MRVVEMLSMTVGQLRPPPRPPLCKTTSRDFAFNGDDITMISRCYPDQLPMRYNSTIKTPRLSYSYRPCTLQKLCRNHVPEGFGTMIICVSGRQYVHIVGRPISPFVPYNVSCPRHHSVLKSPSAPNQLPTKNVNKHRLRQLTAITHSTSTPNSLSMPSPSNGTIVPNFVFAGRNEEGNCGMNSASVLWRCLEGRGSCGERQNRRDEISARENPIDM